MWYGRSAPRQVNCNNAAISCYHTTNHLLYQHKIARYDFFPLTCHFMIEIYLE